MKWMGQGVSDLNLMKLEFVPKYKSMGHWINDSATLYLLLEGQG